MFDKNSKETYSLDDELQIFQQRKFLGFSGRTKSINLGRTINRILEIFAECLNITCIQSFFPFISFNVLPVKRKYVALKNCLNFLPPTV